MERTKSAERKTAGTVTGILLFLFMLGTVFACAFWKKDIGLDGTLYFSCAVLLSIAAILYFFVYEREQVMASFLWLPLLVFLISAALFFLVDQSLTLPLWCFGGFLVGKSMELRIGYLWNFLFLFLLAGAQALVSLEAVVMLFASLVLVTFLLPYVKRIQDLVNLLFSLYAVLFSIRLIFYFFGRQEIKSNDILMMAAVFTLCILLTCLFGVLLKDKLIARSEVAVSFDFLDEIAASTEPETELSFSETQLPFPEAEASSLMDTLLVLSEEDAPARVELRESFPVAFAHSERVAMLACQVADCLSTELNIELLYVGACYHEIGRLLHKNTLANTLQYAREHAFPAPLLQLLQEHSAKGDKPTTKEAALLLLTDNICSTAEYFKKETGGRLLFAKIVDSVITLRLEKGTFDMVDLTARELSVIRNTFISLLKEELF